jgi:hypothetical protein
MLAILQVLQRPLERVRSCCVEELDPMIDRTRGAAGEGEDSQQRREREE